MTPKEIWDKHGLREKGSIWFNEFEYLFYFIKKKKFKNILEIGSWYGNSAIAFAYAMDDLDGSKSLTSIDIRFPVDIKLDLDVQWTKIEASSHDILPLFKSKFDFIFIDGDHSYESTRKDIINGLKILDWGGHMAIHDVNYKPVRNAVMSIFLEEEFHTEILGIDKFHGLIFYELQYGKTSG